MDTNAAAPAPSTVVTGPTWHRAIDHDAVLRALRDTGLVVSWEYPGMACIAITDTVTVDTGLHGYEYGSVSALRGMAWEPEDDTAEPAGIVEGETDPEVIARGWAAWVAAERTRRTS